MALNPIIEAFLAAREQASRDFSQSENRRLQSEEAIARQKHEEAVLKQQLAISKNELEQRKAIHDAEQALTKQQIENSALHFKMNALRETRKDIKEDVAKGLVDPRTTVLTGGQNAPVGQPGQPGMEDMLTQIPQQSQGFDPNVNLETGMFNQLGMPTTQDWNVAPYQGMGVEDAQLREILKSVTPYEKTRERHFEELELQKEIERRNAIETEKGKLIVAAPFKRAERNLIEGGLDKRSAAQIEARRVEGELNRASRERQNSARIAARAASDDASIVIPEGYASDFISARSSSRDLNQLTAKEKSAFSKAYKGAGYTFYTPEELTQLSRIATMGKTVQNVDRLVKLYDEGYEKHAAEIDALNGSIRAVIGNVSRAIAGEKGVLTQPDVERIIGLLPTGWDEAKSGFWNMFAKKNQKFSIAKEKVGQLKEHVKLNYGHLFRGRRPDQVQSVLKQYGAENLGLADELERTFDAAGNETTGGKK